MEDPRNDPFVQRIYREDGVGLKGARRAGAEQRLRDRDHLPPQQWNETIDLYLARVGSQRFG